MRHSFLKLGISVALLFWLFDSSVHYFFYSEGSFEIIPTDIDELWMRVLACTIMVVSGWYVDYAKQISERELRVSENYFRSLVESSPDIVWRINAEGILTYVSPSVKQVLGLEPEELIGLSFDQILDNRESRHTAQRVLSQRLSGDLEPGPMVYELQLQHRDGTSIITEIRSVSIIGEDGEIAEVQGISRDITERSRISEELQRISRLESIGVLAAGIARDLNDFLTGIVGNISIARLDDDPIERGRKLDNAVEDAMRIKDLTLQLLTFAKGGLPLLKLNEVRELIRRSVDFALSGSNLTCDYAIQDDLHLVEIDEGQIRQVINSLVINAQEAMPEGGSIKAAVEMTHLGTERGIPLDPGPYVKISIEDSGVGIPEEDRQRIFDPFFTTKSTGSGLGLATSFSIIQNHKGHISMDSEVGVGTRFDIYLPACEEETSN